MTDNGKQQVPKFVAITDEHRNAMIQVLSQQISALTQNVNQIVAILSNAPIIPIQPQEAKQPDLQEIRSKKSKKKQPS